MFYSCHTQLSILQQPFFSIQSIQFIFYKNNNAIKKKDNAYPLVSLA